MTAHELALLEIRHQRAAELAAAMALMLAGARDGRAP